MRGRPGALELRAATAVKGVVTEPVAYEDDASEATGVADPGSPSVAPEREV